MKGKKIQPWKYFPGVFLGYKSADKIYLLLLYLLSLLTTE